LPSSTQSGSAARTTRAENKNSSGRRTFIGVRGKWAEVPGRTVKEREGGPTRGTPDCPARPRTGPATR
jgi:hypothetical protein